MEPTVLTSPEILSTTKKSISAPSDPPDRTQFQLLYPPKVTPSVTQASLWKFDLPPYPTSCILGLKPKLTQG